MLLVILSNYIILIKLKYRMKDFHEEEFKKTGKNYGHGITHLKLALESLKNGEENIVIIILYIIKDI